MMHSVKFVFKNLEKWVSHPGAQLKDLVLNRPDFNRIFSNQDSYLFHFNKVLGPNYRALNDFESYFLNERTGENELTVIKKLSDSWGEFERRNFKPFDVLITFLNNLCTVYYAREFDKLLFGWDDNHPTIQKYIEVYNYYLYKFADFMYGSENGSPNENAIAAADLILRMLTSNKYLIRSALIQSDETSIQTKTRVNLELLASALRMKIELNQYGILCVEVDKYIDSISTLEN